MIKVRWQSDELIFFFLRILSIFNTHGEMGKYFNETNSCVYLKGS